jgi:hypothetical protein
MRKGSGGIVKWVVIIALLFFGYTKALPWVKQKDFFASKVVAASGVDPSCTELAAAAGEAWGSGLGQFVNPPVDRDAWSAFRDDVQTRIERARDACRCKGESCARSADAMERLRGLVSTMDSAVQTGAAPPSDIPQQQERIDSLLEEAQALVREGK